MKTLNRKVFEKIGGHFRVTRRSKTDKINGNFFKVGLQERQNTRRHLKNQKKKQLLPLRSIMTPISKKHKKKKLTNMIPLPQVRI